MIFKFQLLRCLCVLLGCLLAAPAYAGTFDAAQLGLIWGFPFAAMLLSIALGPILLEHFWHRHYGKVAVFWGLAFLLPFIFTYGAHAAISQIVHVVFAEYLPFIILLTALFTTAGGVCVRGNLHGRPALNLGMLTLGTVLAGIMGTTGAAMLLIRPLIRANDNRKHTTHILVFFIFLVANVGGAFTPLGDPPLFLGFLNGVDFFWPLTRLWSHTLFLALSLLILFYLLDLYYFHQREEEQPAYLDPSPDSAIWIEGKLNFIILGAIIALVLLSGFWQPDIYWTIEGTVVALQNLVRDGGLILLTLISLKITPQSARAGNEFSWEPMLEVAKLFAGIFVTIIPVIAMLKAGHQGPFAPLIGLLYDLNGVASTKIFFWLTGVLSAFLDNAPTYLVFFNLAGGDAVSLMSQQAPTLIAISTASVFMGALTYVGNAPNLMVRAIASHRGLKMPGFFGYMVWSIGILLPLLALLSYFLI